jgi:hypothetical protein
MSGQLSLFSMDLDTPVASEPTLEVGIVPESAGDETVQHNHNKHRRWFILENPKQMEDNKDVTKN